MPSTHTPPPLQRAGIGIDRPGEFLGGAAFSAFGIAFACGAHTFDVGMAGHLGPFYLPLLVGLLIALIGNLVILKSLSLWRARAAPLKRAAWALSGIAGSSLVFATSLGGLAFLRLPTIGLLGGIYIAAFTLRLASQRVQLATFAALAAALAAGSYLAFVVALDIALPVWPTFLND